MRRLPDDRAGALQERLVLHERGQDPHPLAPGSARVIREDWRQAREDVQRLRTMLASVLVHQPAASLLSEAEALVEDVSE